uniref:calcium-transporting ATPase 12, plasma membrane-type-like n=1 Tax=Erigeron canadensis TaxID=72917 RepID=UPI001CB91552|nr:calcium-transporting ATPase 12, plasma membrane-type-like [Erigeron canadensis]
MQEGVDAKDLEMQLLTPSPVSSDGGGSARQILHRAILVVTYAQIFLAGTNYHGRSPSKSLVTTDDENATIDQEKGEADSTSAAQPTPLLKVVNNTQHGRKQIRTITDVLRSTLLFKAHGTTEASDDVHHEKSGATESKSEVVQASNGLASLPEHHIDIEQLQSSNNKTILEIVRKKNLNTLQEFGGLRGVAVALGTDLEKGIIENDVIDSRLQTSCLSPVPTHTIFHFVWAELLNKTVLLLVFVVALSLLVGIYEEGPENGWYDSVVVLIAVVLLVFFGSIRKYWQERRAHKKLRSTEVSMRRVWVIRGGERKHICESKLVYGDVVLLHNGCQVPGDGLFICGQALELDYGSECCLINEQNPFLSYGERVINGEAQMVVTSTFTDTEWSEMMNKVTDSKTKSKLESHLNKLNTCMHYTGLIIGIIIFVVLFFRFIAGKMDDENGYKLESMAEPTRVGTFANKFKKIIKESKYTTRSLTKLLSVLLVGLTEGVPFVVSLAIYYWNDKALCGKATEQNSQGLAKMASVTTICTDVFGDFSEDEMEVEKLFVAGQFISDCTTLSPNLVETICDGIGLANEESCLHWAKHKLIFNKERVMSRIDATEDMEVCHLNGSVNEILSKCTYYYNFQGEKVLMSDEDKEYFDRANEIMLRNQLKTTAFACKNTPDADNLVVIALLGLRNKNMEATKADVKAFIDCEIKTVIMSSKKVPVLENIAQQCGVIDSDSNDLVITGEEFRNYTNEERIDKVDKICVLGEATPSDKLLFVETLREKGEVVAFLGQRTDEAPTLRAADVGIAMGTWSSIKARESCDFIIWDGSFTDLMGMVDSGKCMYHNIQRFLQLVLITTTSSTLICFIETAASGDASITIVQLVWVNMAVSFLGGLALLTKKSIDKPVSLVPLRCDTSIITAQMVRNILVQITYQGICTLIIHLKGSRILVTSEYTKAVVFNMFISCQFFNQFNARELEKKNFFKGIHLHIEFWGSIAIFIVLNVFVVMIEESIGYGTRLNWKLWAICVGVGLMSWVVDCFGKCVLWFI